MAEVVSTGVSHMCNNSTVSVKDIHLRNLIGQASYELLDSSSADFLHPEYIIRVWMAMQDS